MNTEIIFNKLRVVISKMTNPKKRTLYFSLIFLTLFLAYSSNGIAVNQSFLHGFELDYWGYESVLDTETQNVNDALDWAFIGNNSNVGIKFYAFTTSQYSTFVSNSGTFNTTYALTLATYIVIYDGATNNAAGTFNYTTLGGDAHKFVFINDDSSQQSTHVVAYIDYLYQYTDDTPPSISFGLFFLFTALITCLGIIWKQKKNN